MPEQKPIIPCSHAPGQFLDPNNLPSVKERRIFIGGNYDYLTDVLKKIEQYVDEAKFQPILAWDFRVKPHEIYKVDMELLEQCSRSIFWLSPNPAGELMEIEKAGQYEQDVLVVVPQRPGYRELPDITTMVHTCKHVIGPIPYQSSAGLREIIKDFLGSNLEEFKTRHFMPSLIKCKEVEHTIYINANGDSEHDVKLIGITGRHSKIAKFDQVKLHESLSSDGTITEFLMGNCADGNVQWDGKFTPGKSYKPNIFVNKGNLLYEEKGKTLALIDYRFKVQSEFGMSKSPDKEKEHYAVFKASLTDKIVLKIRTPFVPSQYIIECRNKEEVPIPMERLSSGTGKEKYRICGSSAVFAGQTSPELGFAELTIQNPLSFHFYYLRWDLPQIRG